MAYYHYHNPKYQDLDLFPVDSLLKGFVANSHVGLSDIALIRSFIQSRLNGYKTWKSVSRDARKRYIKQMLNEHHENQGLYSFVMH